MVDSPTTRNRLRKQELGTNTNTWGDTKLNQVLDCIDQAMDGVESIALTASTDYTLSTSNYTTTDESLNRVLKFTGTLSAAVNIIVPSVEHTYLVSNECGQSLTVKTSAGTGVVIPTGRMAWVYCDATNVDSDGLFVNGPLTISGVLSGVSAAVAGTDATNLTQVNALIASGAIPGAPGTVKVDAAAASVYLGAALTASGDVTLTNNGDSIDIGVTVPVVPSLALVDGGIQTSSFTAVAGYRYRVLKTSDITVTAPLGPSDGAVILLECIGTGGALTWGRNSENVKGQAENGTIPSNFEGQKFMSFNTQASRGWF